ncbi:ABC transporter ATP-binding protein [Akkermansiaceae bacterium]|nr:ABC transporter ATP-binding protein [Akkermansiaceae bacterium]
MVLELTGIRKTYRGGVEALKGIDLSVPRGCIYGLLGPNGAGKSTLVKILTTLIQKTDGSGTMLGAPIGNRSVLGKVGLLPEHARFPDYLTGRQVIEYSAGLNGITANSIQPKIAELLQMVGMAEAQGMKIKQYSKGMKQRIGIAQALINDPEIIFLDEPTDGVDPAGRRDFRELIRNLREQGKTVFINTHQLSELEPVVDRVAILSQGTMIGEGPIETLRAEEVSYRIDYEGVLSPDAMNRFSSDLVTVENGFLKVKAEQAMAVQPLIDELRSSGVVISGVQRSQQSLEELYLGMVGRAQPSAQPSASPPPLV